MKSHVILLLFAGVLLNEVNAQNEAAICRDLFIASYDITKSATDAISLGVDAVWAASEFTGQKTTTGTLSQSPYNLNSWSYSPSPSDKLILSFAGGPIVSFVFHFIDGNTNSDEEGFKNSHLMDFNIFIQGYMDIRIYSRTHPENDGKIYWERTIKGSHSFDNQVMNLDMIHNGNIYYEISSGWGLYEYTEEAKGTSVSAALSISINENYWRKMIHNSDDAVFVMNTEIINNSSGSYGGVNYKYQNAKVFWAAWTQLADSASAGVYNQVIDANQWLVQGSMLKDGQPYGTLMFDIPVIENTPGPNLVLHLSTGTNYFLHTLIGDPVSGTREGPAELTDYELMQNYPNPFNSSTVISWKMLNRDRVKINIYNILGVLIRTIVDEERPGGINEVLFEGDDLSSGIYFYEINSGAFRDTKKMVILK